MAKISKQELELLSSNQRLFVEDMEREGFEIDYCYSGRGMFGENCPAVKTDKVNLPTKANLFSDSLGHRTVFYARY